MSVGTVKAEAVVYLRRPNGPATDPPSYCAEAGSFSTLSNFGACSSEARQAWNGWMPGLGMVWSGLWGRRAVSVIFADPWTGRGRVVRPGCGGLSGPGASQTVCRPASHSDGVYCRQGRPTPPPHECDSPRIVASPRRTPCVSSNH